MNKFKVLLTVAIVLLAVALLQADEPELVITALDPLTLPMEFPQNVEYPNGDILFWNMQYQPPNILFTAFWYLEYSHRITTPVEIGIVADLHFYWPMIRTRLLGDKLYILLNYIEPNNGRGLMVVTLHQDDFAYKFINELSLDPINPFPFNSACDIVAEDTLVLALADSLVYYNLNTGESQTLMEGDEYQCDSMHSKHVIALPDGKFLFIRDIHAGAIDAPEVWVLFDSAGNHLFTQEITDPVICSVANGTRLTSHPQVSPQRFYMAASGQGYGRGWLEWTYADTGSFNIHYTASPLPNEGTKEINSFGEDKVLSRYYSSAQHYTLYCYLAPLELNPTPLFSYNSGLVWPFSSTASEDIYFVPCAQDGFMQIWAFWTKDFPIAHEFSFPMIQNTAVNIMPSYHGNKLRIINKDVIYFYQVDTTVSNAEDTAVSPVNTLEIYPNPVGRNAGFTIQSDLKKPVELGIYNIRGQKVQTIKLDISGEYSSNAAEFQNLNSGIYLLKPLGKEKLPTRKFVVLK